MAPAVAELRARGIDARGPLPADSLFHEEARATRSNPPTMVSREWNRMTAWSWAGPRVRRSTRTGRFLAG